MPGIVRGAVSTGVLPFSLSTAFHESHTVQVRRNEYHGGEIQCAAIVTQPRRTWKLSKRLTPAQLVTLRNFVEAHPADAFYFYNPTETSPAFSWDATGAATAGRYLVRFNSDWSQTMDIALGNVDVELVEVGSGFGITSAVLSVWCAYEKPGGASPGLPGIGISYDGGATWTGDYAHSGWGSFPSPPFTRQQVTGAVSPIDVAAFRVRAYPYNTLPATSVRDQFEIYDISLALTFSDSTTQTFKPTAWAVEDHGAGTAVNPALCFDADTPTPSTFGYIYRTNFGGLGDPSYLIFGAWQ